MRSLLFYSLIGLAMTACISNSKRLPASSSIPSNRHWTEFRKKDFLIAPRMGRCQLIHRTSQFVIGDTDYLFEFDGKTTLPVEGTQTVNLDYYFVGLIRPGNFIIPGGFQEINPTGNEARAKSTFKFLQDNEYCDQNSSKIFDENNNDISELVAMIKAGLK